MTKAIALVIGAFLCGSPFLDAGFPPPMPNYSSMKSGKGIHAWLGH